jgi:hypothetical protein
VCKRVMHKKERVKEEEQVLHTKTAKTDLVSKEDVVDGREKGEKETQREERQSTGRDTPLRLVIEVNGGTPDTQ